MTLSPKLSNAATLSPQKKITWRNTMPFETNKTKRICPECGKEVANLGLHIANVHPKLMEKLEGSEHQAPPPQPYSSQLPRPPAQNTAVAGDLNALIREKLDTMLNIKIIEMLSKNPDTSLQQISQALNPPQPLGLREIKEYHELVYGKEERELPETGNGTIDLITAAIPLIRDMLPAKKAEMEAQKNVKHSGNKEGDRTILKPISLEVAGDPGEPGSPGKEPGAAGDTEQQNSSSD